MAISSNATGVYCITIGPKFYVGSCTDFAGRMKDHTRKLGYGTHINKFMQAAFNKYGTFDAELIEECDLGALQATEQAYIDQWFGHDDCMNLCPSANTMLGFKHSTETKEKIRRIRTGTKLTEATKAKLRIVHAGRLHTEESKKKMSQALTGKKRTPEQKLATSQRKRRYSDEQCQEMIDRVAAGESQGSVARAFGCTQSAVHAIVHRKRLYQEVC